MPLEAIVGHESVVSLLRHTMQTGRVGHAYIIEGPRGVGKKSLAFAWAAELLKVSNAENHPDFTAVTNQWADASKTQQTLLVDTVRAMKRDAYIRPYSAPYKIYVLPHADTMQAAAQNSILKVLEEPPEYCVLILLAENANAFLPTIRSRASILRLHPLSQQEVETYLTEQKQLPPAQARQTAIVSGGSIGRALELLEDDTVPTVRKEIIRLMFGLAQGTYRDMYDMIRYIKKNRADIALILDILISCQRDLMLYKIFGGAAEMVNTDLTDEIAAMCARLHRRAAMRLCEITLRYQKMIEQNANYSAAVLCMVTEYWEEIHGRNSRS